MRLGNIDDGVTNVLLHIYSELERHFERFSFIATTYSRFFSCIMNQPALLASFGKANRQLRQIRNISSDG